MKMQLFYTQDFLEKTTMTKKFEVEEEKVISTKILFHHSLSQSGPKNLRERERPEIP